MHIWCSFCSFWSRQKCLKHDFSTLTFKGCRELTSTIDRSYDLIRLLRLKQRITYFRIKPVLAKYIIFEANTNKFMSCKLVQVTRIIFDNVARCHLRGAIESATSSPLETSTVVHAQGWVIIPDTKKSAFHQTQSSYTALSVSGIALFISLPSPEDISSPPV